MITLSEKLTQIDTQYLYQIKFGLLSIFKIKTDTDSFNKLVAENPILKDAVYTGTFNSNGKKGSLFFKSDGELLKKSDLSTSRLVFEQLDFRIEYESDIEQDEIVSLGSLNLFKGIDN